MTGLHEVLAGQKRKSCEWCMVATFTAFIALGLGFAHLMGHC